MNKYLIYKIADGVRTREEHFGLLIVSKTTPALSLNYDGKVVWELIDGKNTVEDIINKISKSYQSNSIEEKVEQLLEGFENLKLIDCIQ